jgi:hypothetical protein
VGRGFASSFVAKGAWAIWSELPLTPPCCPLMLRDLVNGTSTVVSATAASWNDNDVGPNGRVAFWSTPTAPAPYETFTYDPGPPPLTTQVTSGAPAWSVYPITDGANVVFKQIHDPQIQPRIESIVLHTAAGSDVVLASNLTDLDPSWAYHISGGWVAFLRRDSAARTQVWRRAPDGTEQQLSSASSGARVEAINENGDVVYTEFPAGAVVAFDPTVRFLARPGRPRLPLGPRLGTPVSIEGDWFVTVGPHLLAIEPAPARSILAEGATGGFFTTDVAILNPNTNAVPVTVTYLREGDSAIQETRQLPARSRTTIHENAIAGLEAASVSTVVDALDASPLVVERLMSWDATGYGGHLGSAIDRPRQRWLFAEGAQGHFDCYFLLANSETRDATVKLTFLVEQGTPVTRTVTVAATSRMTVHAGSVPELIDRSFATVIESNVPVVAERAMYFGLSPLWLAGHGTAGVPEPARIWFHAEGATGSFFDTYILLANPHPIDVEVSLTFVTDTNERYTLRKTVAAMSRLTINIAAEVPQLASAAVSTTVQASDLPIVSERAMYWGPPGIGWREAHDSFGVTSSGTKWGLAEGRAGGARGYQTFVLVSNNTTKPAPLRATFVREDGQIIERAYTIGAAQRLNIEASGIPELANSNFGTVIESTAGVGINVESSIYWTINGVIWEGGGNTTATLLP